MRTGLQYVLLLAASMLSAQCVQGPEGAGDGGALVRARGCVDTNSDAGVGTNTSGEVADDVLSPDKPVEGAALKSPLDCKYVHASFAEVDGVVRPSGVSFTECLCRQFVNDLCVTADPLSADHMPHGLDLVLGSSDGVWTYREQRKFRYGRQHGRQLAWAYKDATFSSGGCFDNGEELWIVFHFPEDQLAPEEIEALETEALTKDCPPDAWNRADEPPPVFAPIPLPVTIPGVPSLPALD